MIFNGKYRYYDYFLQYHAIYFLSYFMKYNPKIHHRRSIRLQNYDYSQAGAYFVTICIHNRECLLGKIDKDAIVLSEYGQIVQDKWLDLINHIDGIELGEYVIMPNHFHGIIIIDSVGAGSKPAHKPEINNMIGADLEPRSPHQWG